MEPRCAQTHASRCCFSAAIGIPAQKGVVVSESFSPEPLWSRDVLDKSPYEAG